jgi:hypothetical protein
MNATSSRLAYSILHKCSNASAVTATHSRIALTSVRSTSSSKNKFATKQELDAYLKEANKKMEDYHKARELKRQGKLKSQNDHLGPKEAHRTQLAIAGVFVAIFLMTPFLGRKIARDAEFREKWVPKW